MSWPEKFHALSLMPPAQRDDLVNGSQVVQLPAGAEVFLAGQPAENLLLVMNGTVRVLQRSDTGREIFLYRVHPGESCVLTTACMMAREDYTADGIAETQVDAVVIPRKTFDDLVGRSPDFRQFVFSSYARRVAELFRLIEDIVVRRVDVRLAEKLLELADDGVVRATHQALATELGTAREVISRTLAEFQRNGWIERSRAEIAIINAEHLANTSRI